MHTKITPSCPLPVSSDSASRRPWYHPSADPKRHDLLWSPSIHHAAWHHRWHCSPTYKCFMYAIVSCGFVVEGAPRGGHIARKLGLISGFDFWGFVGIVGGQVMLGYVFRTLTHLFRLYIYVWVDNAGLREAKETSGEAGWYDVAHEQLDLLRKQLHSMSEPLTRKVLFGLNTVLQSLYELECGHPTRQWAIDWGRISQPHERFSCSRQRNLELAGTVQQSQRGTQGELYINITL